MMVGGIAALLTQMLHPKALAGVWDHSDVHSDMLGRLRRTARFIATTTYAHRDAALQAIAKVNAIHEQVRGTLPDGSRISRDRSRGCWPGSMSPVRSTFSTAGGVMPNRAMSRVDQDRYFAESGEIARFSTPIRFRETRRRQSC